MVAPQHAHAPHHAEFCQPGFGQMQSKRRRGGDATSDVSAGVAGGVLREAAYEAATCASTQAQKQARSAEYLSILLSDCPIFPVEVSATYWWRKIRLF